MTLDDVCAVVLTRGDQPETVERIVRDLPYGEIIVWDNSIEHARIEVDGKVRTMGGRDYKVEGRYEAASYTTRPLVYFQDDDVRFYEHDKLFAAYEPGFIVSNMYDEWIESMDYYDLALVGLGSIMQNGLWRAAFERYHAAFPNDERFPLDCDFVFGALTPFRRYDFGHEILDVASDENRLWRQEGQLEGKTRSMNRARSLRTVTLAMLVKNEEHTAVNAMASAKGLFDNVTIIDTGSTDGTIDAIKRWLQDNKIPGRVYELPWVDFGTNRNQLLNIARTRADYILMMDADETLDCGDMGDIAWPALTKDAYLLHYAGKLDYAQPRLIASRFPWYFDGTVHSALDHPEGAPTPTAGNLRTPLVEHHGWTRHGDEKVKRDIELLGDEIRAGHDVARNTFLLAKAYEGIGDKDRAVQWYTLSVERNEQGGEEHFYSRFRLGVLMIEHLADFPGGCDQLFQAYLDRPQRIESLRALAHFCTVMADATPYPEDDLIIVHRELYSARDV